MITEKNYHRVKSFLDDDTRMNEAKKLVQKPLVKLLLLIALLLALVYVSRYLFNGTAHSVNAFKNLRDAMAR